MRLSTEGASKGFYRFEGGRLKAALDVTNVSSVKAAQFAKPFLR